MSELEELARRTVVDIADLLSDSVEIKVGRNEFYEALDEVYMLLQARFEQVQELHD